MWCLVRCHGGSYGVMAGGTTGAVHTCRYTHHTTTMGHTLSDTHHAPLPVIGTTLYRMSGGLVATVHAHDGAYVAMRYHHHGIVTGIVRYHADEMGDHWCTHPPAVARRRS